MLDESEAWQLVEHLTETTIKQFPNQEIWLLNEWVPKLLQESILYPDRDYLPLVESLIAKLKSLNQVAARDLVGKVRNFWEAGAVSCEGLRAARIVT